MQCWKYQKLLLYWLLGHVFLPPASDKKWRRHYTNSEKKHHSRCELSIDAMIKEKGDRADHVQFVTEMNALFKNVSGFRAEVAKIKK